MNDTATLVRSAAVKAFNRLYGGPTLLDQVNVGAALGLAVIADRTLFQEENLVGILRQLAVDYPLGESPCKSLQAWRLLVTRCVELAQLPS